MDNLESILITIEKHISKIGDNFLYDEFKKLFNVINYTFPEFKPVDSYSSLQDLFIRGIKVSDKLFAYKFWWLVRDYNNQLKRYKIKSDVVLIENLIKDILNIHINELRKLNLDDWRKSNLNIQHEHYWKQINNIKDAIVNSTVRTYILTENNTFIRNVLDITYSKKFQLMIIDYIIKNKITSDPINSVNEILFIDPITEDTTRSIKSSSNVGEMKYLIYLTYNEMLELIDSVRSDVFKKDGISDVRSFLRNSTDMYKFYLYFKVKSEYV